MARRRDSEKEQKMSKRSSSESTTAPSGIAELDQISLDRVSLVQALKDFEIANARVLDLTRRLLDSESQRAALTHELEALRLSRINPSKLEGTNLRGSLKSLGTLAARKALVWVRR